MTSLRIKLPATKAAKSPLPSQSAQVGRKSMKRRYTVDSDEEDEYGEDGEYVKRPRTQQQRLVDSAEEDVGEEAPDVEGTVDDVAPPTPKRVPPSSKSTKHKFKHSADTQQPIKKRRPPVASDPDTEDEYDDPAVESVRSLKGKGRVPAKIAKQSKGKMKTDVADNDERRKAMAKTSDATTIGPGKRSRLKPKGEEDGMVESIPTPDAANANLTHSPPSAKDEAPPPKKRKLPTIKKNKSATSTGPTTPSTASAIAKPTPPVPPPPVPKGGSSILEGSLLPPPTNTRKPAALSGQADFDLRNQDVYNALFKNTGGSTPRSGLSRREKNEERQRELNKMKEEARAKRDFEAKHAFNLQSQMEKIARFEERLRRERNSVLWPNALAAKWRDLWEREKRKSKEQENQGVDSREEGEMTEGP